MQFFCRIDPACGLVVGHGGYELERQVDVWFGKATFCDDSGEDFDCDQTWLSKVSYCQERRMSRRTNSVKQVLQGYPRSLTEPKQSHEQKRAQRTSGQTNERGYEELEWWGLQWSRSVLV